MRELKINGLQEMHNILRLLFGPKIQKGQIYYHYEEAKNPFKSKIRVKILDYKKGWVQFKHKDQYDIRSMERSVFKMIYKLDRGKDAQGR